jgi:hypothetical protein
LSIPGSLIKRSMSLPTLMQFAAFGVLFVVGIWALYLILEMRNKCAAQEALLQRVESDVQSLQKIASQVETAIARRLHKAPVKPISFACEGIPSGGMPSCAFRC